MGLRHAVGLSQISGCADATGLTGNAAWNVPRDYSSNRWTSCPPNSPSRISGSGDGSQLDSGIGREGLGHSIDECTVAKTVVILS